MSDAADRSALVPSGIEGFDEIVCGGLPRGRLYLLEGAPGSGKTTMALQFLLRAAADGARVLYITLSETSDELRAVARSHGWDLAGVPLFELAQVDDTLALEREQTLLHPWEVELSETVRRITATIDEQRPSHVVFDSLSEMRLLAQEPLRYRRQILSLKQYFAARSITALLTDDMTGHGMERDVHLHSLCHGVISLERQTLEFGGARRRLQVQKLRGVDFKAGWHDFALRRGGAVVFPRLLAADYHRSFVGEPMPSGLPALDNLLGGGPLRGTTTLVLGPAGSGKTNLALQYVHAACERGERVAMYEFDERIGTLLRRAELLGYPLQPHRDAGLLTLLQVDPAQISPGEFTHLVRGEVEQHGARLVVIDSLAGYLASMPQERELVLQLHELLAYLNQLGVATILLNTQHGLVGSMNSGGLNVSYLSDAILLLRFFEAGGRIRKALSVLKNRGGMHEESIRELRIDAQGLRIGDVLSDFTGVLSGVPTYVGTGGALLQPRDDGR
jgi:circadian clock protein KaiC